MSGSGHADGPAGGAGFVGFAGLSAVGAGGPWPGTESRGSGGAGQGGAGRSRCHEYDLFEIQRTKIRAQQQRPPGKVTIEIETNHPDFLPRGPLNVTMKVNGELVAEGTAPVTCPIAFSANECLDIGVALGSPCRWTSMTKPNSDSTARSSGSTSGTRPRNGQQEPGRTGAAAMSCKTAGSGQEEPLDD